MMIHLSKQPLADVIWPGIKCCYSDRNIIKDQNVTVTPMDEFQIQTREEGVLTLLDFQILTSNIKCYVEG